ncbi:hypothetical protein VUR80DRAFT_4485 [Thermomyces stellatus]
MHRPCLLGLLRFSAIIFPVAGPYVNIPAIIVGPPAAPHTRSQINPWTSNEAHTESEPRANHTDPLICTTGDSYRDGDTPAVIDP